MICDYCNSKNIKKHYKAETTQRDIIIFVCSECNLIQSWPRFSGIYGRAMSISGGADWGNIRYGKFQSLERSIKFIERYIDLNNYQKFVDIGANRGSFIKFIKNRYPKKTITGIENDKVIFDEELKDLKDINIINEKFENVKFKEKFDFIHLSHTLEHLVSPSKAMEKIRDIINQDGVLYLEVPNVAAIEIKDNITEFFIDKHLFHFSQETLEAYINTYNFDVIAKEILPTYLCYLLKPSEKKNLKKIHFNKNPETVLKIKKYSERLKNWVSEVKEFNKNAKNLSKQRGLAIWGTGRIFDVLWKNEAFNDVKIDLFIDKNLSQIFGNLKGEKINKPEKLKETAIENIIVCSDVFFEEIKNEIKVISENIKVYQYKNLLKKND
jgi:SAM-dependent methyltransferase